jgi:hypothetical protein
MRSDCIEKDFNFLYQVISKILIAPKDNEMSLLPDMLLLCGRGDTKAWGHQRNCTWCMEDYEM